MTRLEWMIKAGREGVQLGIVPIDWAIKYNTYIIYLEFIETLKGQAFSGKKTIRSEAITLTSDKLNIDKSTVWKHISAFDYVSPTAEEITLYKNQTRWSILK